MKVVIIGGVAGGATAAARLRRLDENAEIIILEKTGYVSYANCGLPYYIGGAIKKEKALTLQTPKSFKKRFNIDVRTSSEVLSIDRDKKSVKVKELTSGREYEESYDKLILTPGAKPTWVNIEGLDEKKTFSLRTVEDTFEIKKYIDESKPKSAAIIGGGFIGIEMAENLKEQGLDVSILIRSNQIMKPFDLDMASILHSYLRLKGVNLKLNQTPEDYSREVKKADFVLMATGVAPESVLAEKAGLELGPKKSIVTNSSMQTSDKDIYAAGDAVLVENYVTGAKEVIPLAGPANKQGRIIADNICGINSKYRGSQGSSILKLFELTAATTGINERTAKKLELDYNKIVINSQSHATYYPGAEPMFIKIIFDKTTGRILGAQIIGSDGVDKRIDVLATAIHGKMTYKDLKDLDLAYAPPYSSAKDPVNMAGFVIENVIEGKVKQFFPEDVDSLAGREDITLLDTRTESEFKEGHFSNVIHVPVDELRDRLDEIPKGKPVYVNCYSGLRSYIACNILSENGYDCYNLAGGYGFYEYLLEASQYDTSLRYPCGIKKDE